jgi:hypothetical protein
MTKKTGSRLVFVLLTTICLGCAAGMKEIPTPTPGPPMTFKEWQRHHNEYLWDNECKSGLKGSDLIAPGYQWRI